MMLGERKVSVMDFCRYLVDPFCANGYGTVINTFLDILCAMQVLTFLIKHFVISFCSTCSCTERMNREGTL